MPTCTVEYGELEDVTADDEAIELEPELTWTHNTELSNDFNDILSKSIIINDKIEITDQMVKDFCNKNNISQEEFIQNPENILEKIMKEHT